MDGNPILEKYVNAFYDQYKINFENKKDPEDIVKIAVDLAYKDAQRTMKNINGTARDKAKNEVVNGIIKYLQTEATKEQDKFDESHKSLCNAWCRQFVNANGELTEHGNYGKAQKIVNMAFKYLYCYSYSHKDSSSIKKDHFQCCHFTLDSLTLRWLNGFPKDEEKPEKPKFLNGNLKWSSGFTPTKEEGNYQCENYNTIQNYARKCIGKLCGKGWTVLEAEFFIWDNIGFFDSLKNLIKYRNTCLDNDLLSEDCFKNIKNIIDLGLNKFVTNRKNKLIRVEPKDIR